MDLTFNPELHEYKLNGLIIPSVTQILQEVLPTNFCISPEALEAKADIGRKVHTACEFYDTDSLNLESLHPTLLGYLQGWIRFRKDFKFEPQQIELMLYHPAYRFAGRVDRIGTGNILIDIKSGMPQKSHAIQTAGYQMLWEGIKDNPKIKKRMSVYLDKGGDYKIIAHKEATDKNIFLSALSIYNYKRRK